MENRIQRQMLNVWRVNGWVRHLCHSVINWRTLLMTLLDTLRIRFYLYQSKLCAFFSAFLLFPLTFSEFILKIQLCGICFFLFFFLLSFLKCDTNK